MAEAEIEPDGGRVRGLVLRIGGLAVVVVVAVVLARARAAGMTPPPVEAPNRTVTEIVMRTVSLTVLVAGIVLLLWGRQRQQKLAARGKKKAPKPKVAFKPNRRVLIACLVGFLFALIVQLIGNAANERPKDDSAYRPRDEDQVQTSQSARDRERPRAGEDSGIADGIALILVVLTVGTLGYLLIRRDTDVLEGDEEDEEEAMTRAVQAGREAVADRAITDPREAIVACFAAMESALAHRGGSFSPRAADTPWEVLNRGIDAASLPVDAASTLLRLFREARYSTHPMDDQDRTAADAALGDLLHGLGTPAAEITGEPR